MRWLAVCAFVVVVGCGGDDAAPVDETAVAAWLVEAELDEPTAACTADFMVDELSEDELRTWLASDPLEPEDGLPQEDEVGDAMANCIMADVGENLTDG